MKSAKNFRKNSRRNKNTRKINLKYKNKKIKNLVVDCHQKAKKEKN